LKAGLFFLLTTALLFSQEVTSVTKEKALKEAGITSDEDNRASVKTLSRKKAVLVLPVRSANADTPETITEKSSEILGQVLIGLGRFQVVDRKSMGKAMEQLSLSQTGIIPEDKQLQIGKVVGASEIVDLELASYSCERKKTVSKSAIAGNILSFVLKQAGAGGIVKEKEVMQVQWVVATRFRLTHKDLNSGELLGEKSLNFSSANEVKEVAESELDSQIEYGLTHALRDLFPLKTFVVKADERDITIRLGQDLGIKPNMKFLVYEKYFPGKTNQAVGELRVRDVFPSLSLTELRMTTEKIRPDMTVLEKNTSDVHFGLIAGIAPMRFNLQTFTKINTFATSRILSTQTIPAFGISSWIDTVNLANTTFDLVPQLSMHFSKEIGPSAIDFRLSGLAALPAFGFKVLLGYQYTLIDRDFFSLGFSAHFGGAGSWVPLGTIKNGYTIISDGVDIKSDVTSGSLLSAIGLTFGGEIAAQIGFNLGFNCKLLAEVGYDYYNPINSFSVMTLDSDNNNVNLGRFFETSKAGPVDMTGISLGASLTFMF
jgi:hypothetical protein